MQWNLSYGNHQYRLVKSLAATIHHFQTTSKKLLYLFLFDEGMRTLDEGYLSQIIADSSVTYVRQKQCACAMRQHGLVWVWLPSPACFLLVVLMLEAE